MIFSKVEEGIWGDLMHEAIFHSLMSVSTFTFANGVGSCVARNAAWSIFGKKENEKRELYIACMYMFYFKIHFVLCKAFHLSYENQQASKIVVSHLILLSAISFIPLSLFLSRHVCDYTAGI